MNDWVLPPNFWTVSKHEIIIPDNPVPKIWVSLGGRGVGGWPSLASPKQVAGAFSGSTHDLSFLVILKTDVLFP